MKRRCTAAALVLLGVVAWAGEGPITIRVSPDAYPRTKDIADLVPLLIEDFENSGKGMVDLKLRARIDAIMKRLPKEP